MRAVGTATVLDAYDVRYDYCDGCHFWCTEEPYWLDEAYADAIGRTDTGLVSRNLSLTRRLMPVFASMYGADARFVDWAGGCGLFVRLMRDHGLDFAWQDRYSDNVLARGFEFDPSRGDGRVAAVTAIEALEHAPNPVGFLEEILGQTGTPDVFVTQELHHGVDFDWWYLSRSGGQHVSFFDAVTLAALADRLGCTVHSHGGIHLLTRRQVSQRFVEWQLRTARLRYPLVRRRSHGRTWDDHVALSRPASG
jgi:hypothetical protein